LLSPSPIGKRFQNSAVQERGEEHFSETKWLDYGIYTVDSLIKIDRRHV
jgi:hypothetical protein